MSATLEPIVVIGNKPHVWIARSGPEHLVFGDPYTTACVITRLNDTTAHIEGLTTSGNSMRSLLSLKPVLRNEGFTSVEWERREDGQQTKSVRVTI